MKFVSIVAFVLISFHCVVSTDQTNATITDRSSSAPGPTPTATETPARLAISPAVKSQAKQNPSPSTGKQSNMSDRLEQSNSTLSVDSKSMSRKKKSNVTRIEPHVSSQPTPHTVSRNISGEVREDIFEGGQIDGGHDRNTAGDKMMATITLESASSATLLKNGVKIIHLPASNLSVTTVCEVQPGDVIGVVSQGDGPDHFGVALSVQVNGTCYANDGNHFRARQAFGDKEWTKPGFNACAWHRAVSVDANSALSSNGLSCNYCAKKATFIWGKNCSPRTATFFRFVVGGDMCDDKNGQDSGKGKNRSNPSAHPKPTPSLENRKRKEKVGDNGEKEQKVVDQSDEDDGKGRCKCRQLANKSGGMCYMFTGAEGRVHGRWRRVCHKRQCFASYECVYDGSYSHWCMWKIAKYRIVPIADGAVHAGRTFCRKARLPVPQLFLVPYTS